MFSDECTSYQICLSRNVVFWTKEIHILLRIWNIFLHLTYYRLGWIVNVFFDSVNHHAYLDMLQNTPQLENLGIKENGCFQEKGQQLITHSLLWNVLGIFTGNAGFAFVTTAVRCT